MSADTLSTPIIRIHDLWRTYRAGTAQEVHALRGITINIEKPCLAAVKGRSGSGKTTLLNCIGGLDKPTSGTIEVFDQNIATMSEKQLTLFRRNKVSFIFQSFGLNPSFSATENIDIMLRIAGASNRHCHERTQACIELVGLTRWRDHRPDELSGGQQQRIAIARALANQPRLLLADEPTGDLDTATTRSILDLFKRIVKEEGVTVLLSSHDPLVDPYLDEIFQLSDGELIPDPQH